MDQQDNLAGRIKDEDGLYKALYKLRKLNEEQARDDEQRSKELAETDAWYQSATKSRDNEIQSLKEAIEDFYLRQEDGYKYKSRNGSISRRRSTVWKHDDEELIKAVPEEFIKQSIEWGKLKKTLKATPDGRAINEDGELVPGITTEQSYKVSITLPKGEDKQ